MLGEKTTTLSKLCLILSLYSIHCQAMVEEICNGPCVAMEITANEDVATQFREFVGPSDPVC